VAEPIFERAIVAAAFHAIDEHRAPFHDDAATMLISVVAPAPFGRAASLALRFGRRASTRRDRA
jgi:hypothetical protein